MSLLSWKQRTACGARNEFRLLARPMDNVLHAPKDTSTEYLPAGSQTSHRYAVALEFTSHSHTRYQVGRRGLVVVK